MSTGNLNKNGEPSGPAWTRDPILLCFRWGVVLILGFFLLGDLLFAQPSEPVNPYTLRGLVSTSVLVIVLGMCLPYPRCDWRLRPLALLFAWIVAYVVCRFTWTP